MPLASFEALAMSYSLYPQRLARCLELGKHSMFVDWVRLSERERRLELKGPLGSAIPTSLTWNKWKLRPMSSEKISEAYPAMDVPCKRHLSFFLCKGTCCIKEPHQETGANSWSLWVVSVLLYLCTLQTLTGPPVKLLCVVVTNVFLLLRIYSRNSQNVPNLLGWDYLPPLLALKPTLESH
ncbi:uncharacterized protein RBU33_027550 isoform 1-T1 [Hipposideros larvatus]